MARRAVFITGGTGYLGGQLIPLLVARGHRVRALVRHRSRSRVPEQCDVVIGNPLDRETFAAAIAGHDTFVQLVGVPHPSPAKAAQFVQIDLKSAVESISAAASAAVTHFVYVSVAQPAPVMVAYQAARAEAERVLLTSGLGYTIVRPWYVVGPGHRWATALRPAYWLLERLPATSATAKRLGLVTVDQMTATLIDAVERPVSARIVEVPEIRRSRIHHGAPLRHADESTTSNA